MAEAFLVFLKDETTRRKGPTSSLPSSQTVRKASDMLNVVQEGKVEEVTLSEPASASLKRFNGNKLLMTPPSTLDVIDLVEGRLEAGGFRGLEACCNVPAIVENFDVLLVSGSSRDGEHRPAAPSPAMTPSSSFFIIHEPEASTKAVANDLNNGRATFSPTPISSRSRTKALASTRMSVQPPPAASSSTKSTSSPMCSSQSSIQLQPIADDGEDHRTQDSTAKLQQSQSIRTQVPTSLTILNRCGSAPDLPLHSTSSTSVYSSSKKRLTQIPAVSGAHQVTLQRSRLIPLPIDIRTGTLKRSLHNHDGHDTATIFYDPLASTNDKENPTVLALREQILDNEGVIAAMRQRLADLERERAGNVGYRNDIEKQNQQLRQENRQLHADNVNHQKRVDDLTQQLLKLQHKLEKLSNRYASVYTGLQKLSEKSSAVSDSSVHTVLQALVRENQELHRKVQVLEAQHAEDKALASNHEKKLKRLRAEMEAMHHMDASKAGELTSTTLAHETPSKCAQSAPSPPRSTSKAGAMADVTAPILQNHGPVSGPHIVSAEDYQYIDPNILKVLDKVDSQFSIANAISLSATLKKWMNSCLHIVCSTHIPTVIQGMLKRSCELLHSEHAAVFLVDHSARRLSSVCSERGEVNWELPLDKGILGYAARQNQLCNVRRAYDDPRFYSSTDTITGIATHEVLCVPIVHELQSQLRSTSVFAVFQAWNTTHQKPFTTNDQILGSLLSIHIGAILLQSKIGKLMLKANKKLHQVIRLPEQVAEGVCHLDLASSSQLHLTPTVFPRIAVVDLVAEAEKKLSDCLNIKQLRVFALDHELLKIWHVGRSTDGATGQITRVRMYANATSSVCALALHSPGVKIVPEPAVEPTFNDTVDITGGAGGIYLAPITSLWSSQPMGIIQVARSTRMTLGSSTISKQPSELSEAGAAAAFAREREREQRVEDELIIELLGIFCRVFGGLLLHARAQHLQYECPEEIRNAQLAFLSDRLSWLESEQELEQSRIDEQLAEAERCVTANSSMEQRILDSIQREKLASGHSRQSTPQMTTSRERRNSSGEQVPPTPSELSPITTSRRISSAGSHFRMQTPQRLSPEALYVAEPNETDMVVEESCADETRSDPTPTFRQDSSEADASSEEDRFLLSDNAPEGVTVSGSTQVGSLTIGIWDGGSIEVEGTEDTGVDGSGGSNGFVSDEFDDGESPSAIGESTPSTSSGSVYGGLIATDSAYSIDLG